jgi:hypothetical protein
MIAGGVTLIGLLLLWQFAHAVLKVMGSSKAKPVNIDPLIDKINEAKTMAQKALLEVERQRDEQAKIHALAEETQKLLSQVNLGLGFRPFKKREQA